MNKKTAIDFAIDWIMNVWDSIGEDVLKDDIVCDFEPYLGEYADDFVNDWMDDHSKLLAVQMQVKSPVEGFRAYEKAVTAWVTEKIEEIYDIQQEELEEIQRRDEKNGLYPECYDDAN